MVSHSCYLKKKINRPIASYENYDLAYNQPLILKKKKKTNFIQSFEMKFCFNRRKRKKKKKRLS